MNVSRVWIDTLCNVTPALGFEYFWSRKGKSDIRSQINQEKLMKSKKDQQKNTFKHRFFFYDKK